MTMVQSAVQITPRDSLIELPSGNVYPCPLGVAQIWEKVASLQPLHNDNDGDDNDDDNDDNDNGNDNDNDDDDDDDDDNDNNDDDNDNDDGNNDDDINIIPDLVLQLYLFFLSF